MEWTNTKTALLACAHYSLHIFPCCSALKKHLCRCSGSASGHRRQLRRGVMSEGLGSAIEICMHKMYSVLCTLYKVDKTHHLPTMYISGRRRMHRVAELLLYVVCLRTHSRLDSGAYILRIHIHGHQCWTVSGPSTFLCVFPGAGNRKI